MDRIADIQYKAKCAYKATNGSISHVDLSGYNECGKRAFMRTWLKMRFKFLQTVNEIGRYE